MSNKKRGTLYIGVTNDIEKRVYEHKNGIFGGFTKKYELHKLVYFESSNNIHNAIAYEKKLKSWLRSWKNDLIEKNIYLWILRSSLRMTKVDLIADKNLGAKGKNVILINF